MPNSRSSKKSLRKSQARNEHNRAVKSAVRTEVKRVRAAIEQNDPDGAAKALTAAASVLDKAAKRNIIHHRTVARTKSRLAKEIGRTRGGKAEA